MLADAFATVSREEVWVNACKRISSFLARDLKARQTRFNRRWLIIWPPSKSTRQNRNKRQQAVTLQDIGLLYHDAGDYRRALSYYEESKDHVVRRSDS